MGVVPTGGVKVPVDPAGWLLDPDLVYQCRSLSQVGSLKRSPQAFEADDTELVATGLQIHEDPKAQKLQAGGAPLSEFLDFGSSDLGPDSHRAQQRQPGLFGMEVSQNRNKNWVTVIA